MRGLSKLLIVLATGCCLAFQTLTPTNSSSNPGNFELPLKILLDGRPLKSPVQATYDGFSRRYNTYAYATETLEDGLAYVKVNNPGIWMVRVEKRIEEPTKDYDLYSLKATLVFAVQ